MRDSTLCELTVERQLVMKVLEGTRPDVGELPVALVQLIRDCVDPDPKLRPGFIEIEQRLSRMRAFTDPPVYPLDGTAPQST